MWHAFIAVPTLEGRWASAIRAGLAFAIPATILYCVGFDRTALLAALGGFAVLYGERRPYRVRWRAVTIASAVLVTAAAGYGTLGSWAGAHASDARNAMVVIALVAGASAITFVVNALRLGPPGPFFFVLTSTIASVVTRNGVATTTLVVAAAAGALGALVVSMAPALLRPHGPEEAAVTAAIAAVDRFLSDNLGNDPTRRHGVSTTTLHAWTVLDDAARTDSALAQRLWESMHRLHSADARPMAPPLRRPGTPHLLRVALRRASHARITTSRVAVAACCAGLVSIAIGLTRPDWAILGAVLVLQLGPDRMRGVVRGAHRLAGTVGGLVVLVILRLLDLGVPWLIVVLAILSVLIELTIIGNYAIAVTFITPLAMLVGPPSGTLRIEVRDRFVETLVGVLLAIAALWLVHGRTHRRTWAAADTDVVDSVTTTLAVVGTAPAGSPESLTARRDLQWALLEAELSGSDSAADDPRWAATYWPRHASICQVGHDTLDWCWRTDPATPVDPAVVDMLGKRATSLGG